MVTLSDTLALLTGGTIKADVSGAWTELEKYSNIAHLLDTQTNTFTAYPGGTLQQKRRVHGSAVVELLDKTNIVLLIGGVSHDVYPLPEKSIIDPENGVFGPWTVDKSLDLLRRYDELPSQICKSRNKRVFCFHTVSQRTIQEFIPWMTPQWREHTIKTDTRSSWNAYEFVIWEA